MVFYNQIVRSNWSSGFGYWFQRIYNCFQNISRKEYLSCWQQASDSQMCVYSLPCNLCTPQYLFCWHFRLFLKYWSYTAIHLLFILYVDFSEMGDNRRIAQVRTARSVICRILLLDGKLFEIDVDVSIVVIRMCSNRGLTFVYKCNITNISWWVFTLLISRYTVDIETTNTVKHSYSKLAGTVKNSSL